MTWDFVSREFPQPRAGGVGVLVVEHIGVKTELRRPTQGLASFQQSAFPWQPARTAVVLLHVVPQGLRLFHLLCPLPEQRPRSVLEARSLSLRTPSCPQGRGPCPAISATHLERPHITIGFCFPGNGCRDSPWQRWVTTPRAHQEAAHLVCKFSSQGARASRGPGAAEAAGAGLAPGPGGFGAPGRRPGLA